MNSAPPTVPGMPSACSRPASPLLAAVRARRPRFAPAPARTSAPPSPSCQSTRANPRPSFTTTPRTPPSPTSTFEPPPSLQALQQLGRRPMDGAGTEGQHEIAVARRPDQRFRHLLARRDPAHVEVAPALERVKQLLAGDAVEALLPCRVDVGQEEDVGI